MKKTIAICAAFSMLSSVVALAAPPKTAAAPKDLWVCPMQGSYIKDHSTAGKGEIVAGRRVHFCCGGCQPEFDKLSKKEQAQKVAAAVKKEKTVKQ